MESIPPCDDPPASPQRDHNQQNSGHTGQVGDLSLSNGSVQLTEPFTHKDMARTRLNHLTPPSPTSPGSPSRSYSGSISQPHFRQTRSPRVTSVSSRLAIL